MSYYLNEEIIDSCQHLFVPMLELGKDETNEVRKVSGEFNTNNPRTNKMQETISSRTKTPGKKDTNKSVGKTRESSIEKEKLFKTKTMSNIKNFANTAKNIKSDSKAMTKTPTNKSSIFNEKDSTAADNISKNKTFVMEKPEPPGMKRDKTKPNLKEESTILII